MLGAFLTAELTSFAFSRKQGKRRPVFVYIDECQNFLSSTLSKALAESRKYGMHYFLANQYLQQYSGKRLSAIKDAVLVNTRLKIVGSSANLDQAVLSKELGIDLAPVSDVLEQGVFAVRSGNKRFLYRSPDFMVTTKRRPLSRHKGYLSNEEYARLMEIQKVQYYRNLNLPEAEDKLAPAPTQPDDFKPVIDQLL